MSEVDFKIKEKDLSMEDIANSKNRQGYKVIYPDGYISWSPKEVFEAAYRVISKEEIAQCTK